MKDNGSKFIKAYESFFETDAARRWPDDRPWPGLKLPLNARLIKEDTHIEVNIGQAALGYMKSLLKEDSLTLVDFKTLKDKLLRSWKHYDDFCICCD